MHEQTYMIKVKVKSKSTLTLEIIERTLLAAVGANSQKANTEIEVFPVEIKEGTKSIKEGNSVNATIKEPLRVLGPLSFQPQNSRGELLFLDKV